MDYKLFIPGPCEVDDQVLAAMGQPVRRHYGPEWMELYNEIVALLQKVFQTENSVFIVPGSGSAGLDMAFGSLFNTGDTVLIGDNGFFGERLEAIAKGHGLRVTKFTSPLGEPLDPSKLKQALAEVPDAKAVAVVHHETGTTVLNPLEELARVARNAGVPVIVDAIASLGGVPLPVDDWGIDVCVTVPNKCLECPPGVALLSVSPSALEMVDRRTKPRGWYLDLQVWRDFARKWSSWHPYPVTLPTNNILALRVNLRRILEQGLEAQYARYRQAAKSVRRGLEAIGFEMLVNGDWASPIATAVKARPEFPVDELVEYLAEQHGILVSGGLGPYEGKAFRIGHMGKASLPSYITEFLLAVEAFLRHKGLDVTEGASLVGLAEGK